MSRSDGRPSTDAEFQNLKSGSNITTRRITAQEVSSSAVIAGEVVADVGAFNTLNVENLTVMNEVLANSHVILPLMLGTLSNNGATYNSTPILRVVLGNPSPVIPGQISWTAYVPNSGVQRHIRFAILDPSTLTNLEVVVNGTTIAINPTIIAHTGYAFDTSPFDWTVSGTMTVVIKCGFNSGATFTDDVVVW